MNRWELPLLAAWVAAPWAPAPWAALLLLGSTAAWLATRPPRREAWLAAVGIVLALAALGAGLLRGPRVPPDDVLRARLESAYARLWSDLSRQAEVASGQVSLPFSGDRAKLELLARLADLAEETDDAGGRTTLLVVDPDGRAVVWAGEGLLHELEAADLPRRGPAFEASFGAVTFLVAEPLTPAERPWRLVAARSLPLDHLPLVQPAWAHVPERRWSVTDDPDQAVEDAWQIRAGAEAPILVVAPASRTAGADLHSRGSEPERRMAWGGLAFALFSLLVLRTTGLALPGAGEAAGPPRGVVGPALAGTAAAGFAAAVPPVGLGALGLGVTAVLWALHRLHEPPLRMPPWARALGGAAVALAVGAAAWGWQEVFGPQDLAAGFFASPSVFALRLALFGLTLGLLVLAGGHGTARRPREGWAWLAVFLLLIAWALHDGWLFGASLVLLGSAAGALWLHDRRVLARPGPLAVLVLLAALVSTGAWETVYRHTLRQTLAEETLPRMAPPEEAELAALATRVRSSFDRLDLTDLVPRSPQGLERRDLAYTLWTRSPLSLANTFSSLVIEPETGPASTFSFGLRLNDDLVPERPPQRIPEPTLPGWDAARIAGRGRLLVRGRPWARVSWWLAPRPGFRLLEERHQEATGEALLAGGPRIETEVEGLPGSVVYALYDTTTRRTLLSPWTESSPLPPELEPAADAPGGLRATTPAGAAWAYPRWRPGAVEVLYLPVLTPPMALERAGTHAASVLLALGLLVLAGLLLALPRPGFRSLLQRTFRSYSKRLILVYTALLLLPLLSVNVLLVAGAEERLGREQRAAGLAALDSAERLLVENMLSQQPGFDLKTALDNEELTWLSQVVHHDVNLYWENDVWASSKSELFAAGLLPKRIPGEVHARLDLLGFDQASRTNRVGDTRYLELYSPVRIPGEPGGRAPLSLSLPLLAQQEQVARELATLRRQVFLVTAVLFVLLVAVGLRLARSFTEPIDELVEGTRRIAAGAPSLNLAPTELELAALVEAIDDMADKIARGRRRLLREKQVVERIVENITSGVLSLDRERRVLLRNRVAADLLGVDVGTSLTDAADRLPEPVAAFLAQAGDEPRQKTVRLTSGEEDREWNLVWVPVPGDGEPAALLVVEDATDILRGQRLEAWAEMARIIAHEIKNPLTPIRLNAEHAAMVYESDPDHFRQVFERCMGNILSQVAELQQIASEFSTYSSILRIERKRDDLVEAMEELVEPYRAAPPDGLEIRFETGHESLEVLFDRRLLTRAVRNLLENALRASSGGGAVTLSVAARDEHATITVADSGPGVDPALLTRIFDPYFSTHDAGTGLGLPIARRVAEEHGGSIAARNLPDAGLSVAITIPL